MNKKIAEDVYAVIDYIDSVDSNGFRNYYLVRDIDISNIVIYMKLFGFIYKNDYLIDDVLKQYVKLDKVRDLNKIVYHIIINKQFNNISDIIEFIESDISQYNIDSFIKNSIVNICNYISQYNDIDLLKTILYSESFNINANYIDSNIMRMVSQIRQEKLKELI